MASNPSKQGPILNPATQRGSRINDPQFSLSLGYSPFDLTHSEVFTSRFGEYTPSMHIDTIPADRFVIRQNLKTIHNRIDGNLLSTVNQYDETFYVSLANLIPNAYERFIPNPTKGDDLPNSALPQVPFELFLANMLFSRSNISIEAYYYDESEYDEFEHNEVFNPDFYLSLSPSAISNLARFNYANAYMMLVASVLSRGQLLDYLGVQYDVPYQLDARRSEYNSELQYFIDQYYVNLWRLVRYHCTGVATYKFVDEAQNQVITNNNFTFRFAETSSNPFPSLSKFREFLYDCIERGELPLFTLSADEDSEYLTDFRISFTRLLNAFRGMFEYLVLVDDVNVENLDIPTIGAVDSTAEPFARGYLNALKPLAYQLCVAQYGTNDLIDNIYTADLYMQNMRSVMFPSVNDLSSEPVYNYNGVEFEYDMMTFGAWRRAFLDTRFEGSLKRSYIFATIFFYLRRSLRFGDYFSTARPNMLAVGDLYINVVDGKVSPIDTTKNLLMQRYLNSANYLGNRIDSLYSAVYDVVPSDRPVAPRYVSHRKTVLAGQITTNTADAQGQQTTNLVGYTDGENAGIDVFLDDYGVIISVVSYDVLPLYTSGIDSTYRMSDRFDFFNPQLQNIGDQAVLRSELFGDTSLNSVVFGYQMRNAEHKYKISRAHGALVNELSGFVFKYPPRMYLGSGKISPDFIRDKPYYFDQLVSQDTGISPGAYYHFIVSAVNEVSSARKMQATPPILF